jgi:hypothetical protein
MIGKGAQTCLIGRGEHLGTCLVERGALPLPVSDQHEDAGRAGDLQGSEK